MSRVITGHLQSVQFLFRPQFWWSVDLHRRTISTQDNFRVFLSRELNQFSRNTLTDPEKMDWEDERWRISAVLLWRRDLHVTYLWEVWTHGFEWFQYPPHIWKGKKVLQIASYILNIFHEANCTLVLYLHISIIYHTYFGYPKMMSEWIKRILLTHASAQKKKRKRIERAKKSLLRHRFYHEVYFGSAAAITISKPADFCSFPAQEGHDEHAPTPFYGLQFASMAATGVQPKKASWG